MRPWLIAVQDKSQCVVRVKVVESTLRRNKNYLVSVLAHTNKGRLEKSRLLNPSEEITLKWLAVGCLNL